MYELVKFDTSASSTTPSSGSFSLTVAANNNRLLVVSVATNNTSVGASSITYNGVALTQAVSQLSNSCGTQIYYLVAPATGSNTLSYTLSGSTNTLITAMSFYNVNQVSPLNTTRKIGVASGSYTGAIAVPENGLFVDTISCDAQSVISPNAGQTLVSRANGTYGSMGSSYYIFTTANASYTSSWNNDTFQSTTVYAEAVFNPALKVGGSFLYNLL